MPQAPNIVLLSVDALRADRVGHYGYGRPTTPAIDRLAADALVCRNAFSLGPFTQSACVQMFTCTRPFSYGGYDMGAIGRPKTLFARFREEGYRTVGLSTLHWVNRYYGYGDGFDDEHQLFTILTVASTAIVTVRNSLMDHQAGRIGDDAMLATVDPVLDKMFADIDDYIAARNARADDLARLYPHSQLVNAGYAYDQVAAITRRHREAFRADPAGYVRRHLHPPPQPHEWLGREWRYARRWPALLEQAWVRATNRIVARISPALARCRQSRHRTYVDAASLASHAIEVLEAHDRAKPLFLWVHFMDAHLPYVSGRGTRWYRETPRYLAATGHPTGIDPSRAFGPHAIVQPGDREAFNGLYDAAVRWTDEQIGRIAEAVERLGLAGDTWIVVVGDHGEELGDHGQIGHQFVPYEHHIRVPMLFHRKGLGGRAVDGLVASPDLGPTLASLAGIEPDPRWEGAVAGGAEVAERDHVVVEMFYRGNCLFETRPLYMAVRTKRHKLFWKEFRDPQDKVTPDGHELYDLIEDPAEQRNLYRPDHPALPGLVAHLARRLRELPQISEERLAAALKGLGVAAPV